MLASRGFVYWSEDDAGGAGHAYHSNCDCIIVPGFSKDSGIDEDSQIEGYKPSELRERYKKCYNAINPNGTWEEVYEEWKNSETDETWEKFKSKALVKEIKTRDWGWLWNEDKLGVDFISDEIRERKERDYVHEVLTAKKLCKNGIRCLFQEDEISKNGITTSYADLANGYELKTLMGCSSENTVIGHLKNCSRKKDAKVAVFDNSINEGMTDEELIRLLKKSLAFRKGKVYILNKDEELRFVR